MPNLSVEKIAGALAVLGTTFALAACGGEEKPAASPVNATETKAPSTPAAEAAKEEHHCGAGSEHKGGASCGAKPGDTSAAAASPATAAPAATPAPVTEGAKPADPMKAEPKKDDGKKADKKPAPPPAPAAGGKKATGAASCGAGTCAAKK